MPPNGNVVSARLPQTFPKVLEKKATVSTASGSCPLAQNSIISGAFLRILLPERFANQLYIWLNPRPDSASSTEQKPYSDAKLEENSLVSVSDVGRLIWPASPGGTSVTEDARYTGAALKPVPTPMTNRAAWGPASWPSFTRIHWVSFR